MSGYTPEAPKHLSEVITAVAAFEAQQAVDNGSIDESEQDECHDAHVDLVGDFLDAELNQAKLEALRGAAYELRTLAHCVNVSPWEFISAVDARIKRFEVSS